MKFYVSRVRGNARGGFVILVDSDTHMFIFISFAYAILLGYVEQL